MVYNDTTNNQGILQECESIVFDSDYGKITGNTTLLQTFTRYCNEGVNRVSALSLRYDNSWEFFDSNSEFSPIETEDLEANKQIYTLETRHAKVLKVRIKDQNGEWRTLRNVSRRSISDNDIDDAGSPEGYDMLADGIYLFPKPNYGSTNGLEAQIQAPLGHFLTTDTTKEPGFNSMFHRLVPLWGSYLFTSNKRLAIAKDIRQEILVMQEELKEFFSQRDHGKAHSLELRKEDYGSYELGTSGTYSDLPRGFYL